MHTKIVLFFCLFVMVLTGCAQNVETSAADKFTLSKEEKNSYMEKIDDTLYAFYWKYDKNTVSFFEEAVPNDKSEKNEAIFTASLDAGFDLRKSRGRMAVVATVDLTHFNSDKAGLAYFYFVKNELVGVYYKNVANSQKVFSLNTRNVFIDNTVFTAYETDAPAASFKESRLNFSASGICAIGQNKNGNTLLAVINGNYLEIYEYSSYFRRIKRHSFSSEGLVPMSAAFFNGSNTGDRLAILLGTYIVPEGGQGEVGYTVSEKIVLLDDNMNKTSESMELSTTVCTALGQADGKLVAANGQTLQYYEYTEEGFQKEKQYYLPHSIMAYLEDDLDGDGSLEYLLSDGMDFYLYRKTATGFQNIWRTHLSIESLQGNIFTGDLNQDGIKEIYVCDKTGTTIRYVLGQGGLVSRNDDIEYGERLFVGDFNLDGKTDYMKTQEFGDGNQTLYIAQ